MAISSGTRRDPSPLASESLRCANVIPSNSRAWTRSNSTGLLRLKLEQVEALELLGMTLAHLNDAEARGEVSPRVPLLMAIRDKLAAALREEP